MTILQLAVLILGGFAIGWVARDLRPTYWPHIGHATIYVGPSKNAEQVLQLNLDGRSLGWIELTPQVTTELQKRLAEAIVK